MSRCTAAGDEIRLKHPCPNIGAPPWTGSGLVVRLNETSEEVLRRYARRLYASILYWCNSAVSMGWSSDGT